MSLKAFKHSEITETQSFYDENAQRYFENTVHIDVGGLRARYLRYVPDHGLILDAGSGSGRDTLAFRSQGYEVEAFDSSAALAELSTKFTGVRTYVRTFEEFNEPSRFDGIWACASLLHVAEKDLPNVLGRLIRALKPQGALYASFKEGVSESTDETGRRFTNLTQEKLEILLGSFSSVVIRELWSYSAPSSSKPEEVWINVIATRS